MGTTPSRYDDLSKNVHLERFCGKNSILPNDPFWDTFLSYNMRAPVTRNDQIELDSRLDSSCQQLLANNLSTGNFGSLIQVALMRASNLLEPMQNQKCDKFSTMFYNFVKNIKENRKLIRIIYLQNHISVADVQCIVCGQVYIKVFN